MNRYYEVEPDPEYDQEAREAYSRGDYSLLFADPGGNSSLRAATYGTCQRCSNSIDDDDHFCRHCGLPLNPRVYPCPTCGEPDRLTLEDTRRGYQCNTCADRMERGY